MDCDSENPLRRSTLSIAWLAMAESGTAIVRDIPWYLDGLPHLCVACDHRTFEGLEARLPNVVTAMWRAAQSGGWRELEWKPIEIEWPRIALVNLVRGKALLPAHSTISTASLFAPSDSFRVQAHHYTAVPVSSEAFASSGFTVWDSPLLRAAVSLEGNLLAFAVTYCRFYHLAILILEQNLEQTDTDRVLARFSSEMGTVLTVAQRSYASAVQILKSSSFRDKQKWIDELNRVCSMLLVEVDEHASMLVTLDTFTKWIKHLETVTGQFRSLIREIATSALDTDSL